MTADNAPIQSAVKGDTSGSGFTRYLDAKGSALQPLPDFAKRAETLISFYRAMVLTRVFDEKAVALQRTGRLGTYATSLGQEAVGVGVASAMRESDVLLPSFREQSAMLWRGVTMPEILAYWAGTSAARTLPDPVRTFPSAFPSGRSSPRQRVSHSR